MSRRLNIALSVLALTSASVLADESIDVLEVGLYEAITVYADRAINTVRNPRLLRRTSIVPAKLGTRFGLRYRLRSSSEVTHIEMTFVTRYLGTAFDPSQAQTVSEYSVPVLVGVSGYREFQFDDERELVPGIWTFEFWLSGQKLGEQQFCVFKMGSALSGCEELNS